MDSTLPIITLSPSRLYPRAQEVSTLLSQGTSLLTTPDLDDFGNWLVRIPSLSGMAR